MKPLVLLVTFIAMLTSCTPLEEAGEDLPAKELKVKIGQQAQAGQLRIEFVALVQDSRCPENTQCVWAGNAQIKLKVAERGGRAKDVVLNTTTAPTSAAYGDKQIRLVDVLPHPKEGASPAANAYVAILNIEPKTAAEPPRVPAPTEAVPY